MAWFGRAKQVVDPNDVEVFFWDETDDPERMWVRLLEAEGEALFTGTLLNQPHCLTHVSRGDRVRVRAVAGAGLFHLTEVMEADMRRYRFDCSGCGFDMLLVPAKTVIAAQFPQLPEGAQLGSFTTRCPWCQETLVAMSRQSV